MSVDALRGFDMFWIIGADALVYALQRMNDTAATRWLAGQLDHAAWAGFRFYDLIFPLFVFIVGVSTVFSLSKTIAEKGRGEALKRVFTRSVLLFAVALFYSKVLEKPWPDMRLLGVLNRIALCYFFGGLIFIYCKPKVMAGIAAGLLVGYWALMTFAPIRDIQLEKESLLRRAEQAGDAVAVRAFKLSSNPSSTNGHPAWVAAEKMYAATTATVTGKFESGYNVANHFDFKYLPGRKYDQYWDPEGILSTLPAIVTCLLGVFAGLLLQSGNFCDKWKLIYLVSLGTAGVLLGYLWGHQFPVIKKIWSSSFVLVAGGFSSILLAGFYYVVDVLKWQRWCQPFVWMGMNSITIYVVKNMLGTDGADGSTGFSRLAKRFVGGDIKAFFDTQLGKGCGDVVIALVGLLLAFWLVRFLYQRKVFIRL
jgi:predicted acyltransferase